VSTRRSGSSDLSRHSVSVAVALLLALALVAAACSTPETPPPTATDTTVAATTDLPGTSTAEGREDPVSRDEAIEAFNVDPATWEGCGDGLECATVAVPLDHAAPTGPTIDLALIRVPAPDRDGSGIVGSIFVNPGGPGGSGVGTIRSGFRLDDETMDDHHLVGFDPRGVGLSAPLTCGPAPSGEALPDLDPDDEAEREEMDRAARDLAERCAAMDGDLLPHLSTPSVVADLDLLRRAVGDEQLDYIGLSYGTYIGLRYVERFPERVGRMVLDGVVDPEIPLSGLLTQQSDGFDRLLDEVDAACGTAFACPPDGIIATYDRVAERLDTEGPSDGVGPTELATGTLLGLYAESLWPRLSDALSAADRGDYGPIRALYDIYLGAADVAAYNAVVCSDGPVPRGEEAWDRFEQQLEARSPRFGAFLANEVRACAYWPVRATTAPEPVSPDEVAPILVLSTTGDAATPVENAITVAAALPGAGLVTVEDSSHTAYGRNFCVDRIVADYFATGRVPSSVHRC
jgi:pimeloyl-ACP methyl ester carboxylesterase